MLILSLLAGIWTTTCIQTQISNVHSGYAKETYTFEHSGSFEFKREWFKDPKCNFPDGTDTESGTVQLGDKISTIFMPGDVYKIDFSTQSGVDLGTVLLKKDEMHIARGVRNGKFRNTMLSLFSFSRQNPTR